MDTVKIIAGSTADEIWAQIANDFQGADILEYNAVIQQEGLPETLLEIEIDLGGGFEGGYEWTRFSGPVAVPADFRFALHHEGFLDKAGKLIGLEDKAIGYDDFDKEFIIKTNDEDKAKAAFADASVRSFFQALEDFNLHITHHEETAPMLELEIERGVTDATELRTIYEAFIKVQSKLQ
jgi:hypothetical protein